LVSYREKMGTYPRILIGLADIFGLIDRDRLVSALHAALKRVAEDPGDPVRERLGRMLAALADRLRHQPNFAARVEATKDELLASAAIARLIEDAVAGLRRAVVADLASEESEVVAWITARLERAREQIVADDRLRRELDQWMKLRA